jgi:hypothetical protein
VTGVTAGVALVVGTVLFLPVLLLARFGRWRSRAAVAGLSSGVIESRTSVAGGVS